MIDSDLNVDEIGKNFRLSRVQLYRKIKSLTNYAHNELVRIIRLKAAEQLRINTEIQMTEAQKAMLTEDVSLILSIGVEFGTIGFTGQTQEVKYAGSGKVMKVG